MKQVVLCATAWLGVVLGVVLGGMPLAAQDAGRIGVIPVREEVDGAGPSNVFHLHGNVVALVDPLKADIKAFDMVAKTARGACAMPRDFRPWRLVRGRDAVAIVDEAERRTLDIPRRTAFGEGCRLHTRAYNAARNGHHRLRRVDHRTIAVPPRRGERGRPLGVRSAAYELLSARELERDRAGNRYVLAKILRPAEAAHPGRLGVTATVLRYDRLGRINGAYRVPFEERKKRAFDYVTVLPAGDLVLALYDKASDNFRLERVPMPFMAAARRNVVPANAPTATHQEAFEMATEPLAAGPAVEGAEPAAAAAANAQPTAHALPAISGAQIVAEARRYLDLPWQYHRPAAPMTPKGEGTYDWQVDGKPHVWVQPAHQRGIAEGTRWRGLPYNYGGIDTPSMFLAKMRQGAPAGHLGAPILAPGDGCAPDAPFTATAGIDCSALLGRAWKIDLGCVPQKRFSTSSFKTAHEAICPAPVPSFAALKEGDAINMAGNHVVIFLRTEAPDGASKMVRVIESASRCSGVCEARYELDAYDGYILHRRAGRSDASCPKPPAVQSASAVPGSRASAEPQ